MSWKKWRDICFRLTKTDIIKRYFGRGICPYQLSFVLGSALRRLVLSPEELVDRLRLNGAALVVLEVGPGPGFFSVKAVRHSPT